MLCIFCLPELVRIYNLNSFLGETYRVLSNVEIECQTNQPGGRDGFSKIAANVFEILKRTGFIVSNG